MSVSRKEFHPIPSSNQNINKLDSNRNTDHQVSMEFEQPLVRKIEVETSVCPILAYGYVWKDNGLEREREMVGQVTRRDGNILPTPYC